MTSDETVESGQQALIRGAVLIPPVTVESVRVTYCGHAESEPVVSWRHTYPGYGKVLQESAEHELAPVPVGYEAPPSPMGRDGDWYDRALEWVDANLDTLTAVHGREATFAQRERLIRQIKRQQRIDAAIAVEPGASAMRRAEIAMGVE